MKKLMAITLCTAIAISLAGCSGNSSPEDPVPQTSVEIPNRKLSFYSVYLKS